MNSENEKIYNELHNKQLTTGNLFSLTCAMKEVADAVGAHSVWESLNKTTNALRYLNEFRAQFLVSGDLTPEESNLSAGLHSYMRKCMDNGLGSILYMLISEDRGKTVWYSFIKVVNANRKTPRLAYIEALDTAEDTYTLGNNTTDDLLMLSALKMWDDGFEDALEWVIGE